MHFLTIPLDYNFFAPSVALWNLAGYNKSVKTNVLTQK